MQPTDFRGNFLVRKEDSGRKLSESMCEHLQELNPRAHIKPISSLRDFSDSFSSYSAVIFCNPSLEQLKTATKGHCFAAFTNELSCLFIDLTRSEYPTQLVFLLKHSFLTKIEQNALIGRENQPVSLLDVVANLREGRPMKESAVPVCAVTGGVISQLVMKMVTEEEVEDTAFEFDAVSGNGTLYTIFFVCYTQ